MRYFLISVLPLALAGCGSINNPISKSDVAALRGSIEIAERLAMNYVLLPPCGLPKSPKVCSDPVIKERVKEAGHRAYLTGVMLRDASDAELSAAYVLAQAALSNLSRILPATSSGPSK